MNKMMLYISGSCLLLLYLLAIGADFLAPYRYDQQNRKHSYAKPHYSLPSEQRPELKFWVEGYEYTFLGLRCNRHLFSAKQGQITFLLGADKHGRDIFSRLLKASRVSLTVGLIAVLITFCIGMLIGGLSGYFGGLIDNLLMRFCELLMCFPFFYLMLALRGVLPSSLSSTEMFLAIVVILSFVSWPGFARVIRGMVLSLREREYVLAAQAAGISHLRIIARHILPSTFSYGIVSATLSIPSYILGEAGLSFLGLGIAEPAPSWGNMLTEAMSVSVLQASPWVATPGLMIVVTVLSFNLFGDGLRDLLDPKKEQKAC